MSNMSYCRFRNTLNDLKDCEDHMDDKDISSDEKAARAALIILCYDIYKDWFEEDDEE